MNPWSALRKATVATRFKALFLSFGMLQTQLYRGGPAKKKSPHTENHFQCGADVDEIRLDQSGQRS